MAKRTKASVYHIPSNYSRAAEDRILSLAERAREGDIHGMTYVISDRNEEVKVGRIGSHKQNKAIALGTMFQAAVALVMAA